MHQQTDLADKNCRDSNEPVNSDLVNSVTDMWHQNSWLKPSKGELAYEMLGKVFLSVRAVTDSMECRQKNPDASRLEVGLSYEAIRRLLSTECRIELAPDDLTLAMDMCVDNGQAVPKVIVNQSIWLRAFYSGEREDSHETLQLKNAIYKAYSEFFQKNKGRPLTAFDMHKMCVTLKDIFPWLPISTRYYTFGRFAKIGRSERELVQWLVDPDSGPLSEARLGKKKVLVVNESYKPCVNPTWKPEDKRDFDDSFQYIAKAFSKLGDEPKLLLSTCRSHMHTYSAVAFEGYSWTRNEYYNFQTLLNGIKLVENHKPKITDAAIISIYWCTRYMSEALRKYVLFHSKFKTTAEPVAQRLHPSGLMMTPPGS